jgi:hypothetical protein
MKKVTLKEFRLLVRKLVNEYVANTDGSPTKDNHADPTAKAWDAGLDETEEVPVEGEEMCAATESSAPWGGPPDTCDMPATEQVDGDPFCKRHALEARQGRTRRGL